MGSDGDPAGGLWKIEEAAAFLKTTAGGIYKLVERRAIPHIRLGRRILFDPAELRAWLQDHRVAPGPIQTGRH